MRGNDRIKRMITESFHQLWSESHYDKIKGEVVATKESFLLSVSQGEVLRDSRNQRRFDLNDIIERWYAR